MGGKKVRRHEERNESRAAKIFTDREEPQKSFWNKFNKCKDMPADDQEISVLVYYGIGGIGKTSLLLKLKGELEKQKKKNAFLDLGTEQEPRNILEQLKNQLVKKYNFSFHLFELCLFCYQLKIGEDVSAPEIKSFISRSSFLSTLVDVADPVSFLDPIGKVFKAADSSIASLRNLIQNTSSLMKDLRRKDAKQLCNEMSSDSGGSYLRMLVENHKSDLQKMRAKDASQLYDEMAYYFALDLEDNLTDMKEPLVVFFDTYEALVNEISSTGEALNDDLWLRGRKGLIENVPNVLWVIAGREKLKWEKFDPDWAETLEQHILEKLSDKDADDFLIGAGIEDIELREAIYNLTQGTPVYLDLCVDTYEAVRDAGKIPTINDFGKNVFSLVARFLKYMDDEKKAMVYVLSCLQTWDYDLLKAVWPNNLGFTLIYDKVKGFSFISSVGDNKYRIHQTIGEILFKECPEDLRRDTFDKANDYCKEKLDNMKVFDPLYPSFTRVLLMYVLERYKDDRELAEELYKNIRKPISSLIESAQFDSAQRLLNIARNRCDKKELSMAVLDVFYSHLSRYKGEYQKAYESATKGFVCLRDGFGEDHEATILAKAFLANSLYFLGKIKEALKQDEEVLSLRKKVLGEEHPDTISAMNSIACEFSDLGRYEETLKMQEEVLSLRKRILGEEHPDTITAMSNLAVGLGDLGRYEEAMKMQEDVLSLRKRILGEEHPGTISAMNNLANSLSDLGRYEEALKMKEEVLSLRKRILGEEHPGTISAMNNLASSLSDLGRYEEALKMQEDVLSLRKRILGEEHPETISAMVNLAVSLSGLDRYEEAMKIEEEVLSLRERILGDEHPETISAMANLAVSLSDLGLYEEALKMQEDVLTLRKRILGEEHPDTILAVESLAACLHNVDRHEEAEALEQELEAMQDY